MHAHAHAQTHRQTSRSRQTEAAILGHAAGLKSGLASCPLKCDRDTARLSTRSTAYELQDTTTEGEKYQIRHPSTGSVD